jgi:hypothetical protein
VEMRRSVVMSSRARCGLCLEYVDAWDRFHVFYIAPHDQFPLYGSCCRECLPDLPFLVTIDGVEYMRAIRSP